MRPEVAWASQALVSLRKSEVLSQPCQLHNHMRFLKESWVNQNLDLGSSTVSWIRIRGHAFQLRAPAYWNNDIVLQNDFIGVQLRLIQRIFLVKPFSIETLNTCT